jgi:hypothetical protein
MHCTDFHHRLDALLDARRDPAADQALTAHAANCDRCNQVLSGHVALLQGVSAMPTPQLDPAFAQRVVTAAALAAPQYASPRFRWRTGPLIVAVLASAAAMLVAVSMWFSSHAQDSVAQNEARPWGLRIPIRGFAITSPPRIKSKTPDKPMPGITIADVLLQTPRLPHRLSAYSQQLDLAVALPAATRRMDELEHLAPGLRPLRASLAMIWETLLLSIPAPANDSSPPPRDGVGSLLEKSLGLA